MIDVTSETLILPTEVTQVLPKQKGKKTNLSTIYRWMQHGICGVRLEFVCIGGTRFTSTQALNRFFSKVTAIKSGVVMQADKSKSTAKKNAELELDKAGI